MHAEGLSPVYLCVLTPIAVYSKIKIINKSVVLAAGGTTNLKQSQVFFLLIFLSFLLAPRHACYAYYEASKWKI